jgi:hypothetical protein
MRGYWKTLRVAPSDANRVYVTGYQMSEPADAMAQPTPLLFRTDNATEATVTWLEIPWSHGGESQLKLLGVSRADPDLVFARIDEVGNNTVFRSDDGGIGWNQVLSFTNADANAFVSSADGMTIVIGSDYGGAKISRNAGVTWEDLPGAPQMVCAGVRTADEEYFSCGANWEPDMMAFGKSSDLATFSSLFRFVAIDGPLDCPDSTPQGTECEPNWCMTCQMFGCPDPNCTPIGTDARVPDGGPGIGGDGGGGNGGGCGCAISDRGGLAGALLLVAGALALLRGVRRRRRR